MTERITVKEIEGMLDRLNGNTKGRYQLDQSYGGYRLEFVLDEKSGGVSDISFRHTKREIYDVLYTCNRVLENERERTNKRKDN